LARVRIRKPERCASFRRRRKASAV